MQTVRSFQCPHCAAPVPFQYGQVAAKCEYCGNTVIVPPELRPPPPQPQQPVYQYPQVQIVIGSDGTYTPQPPTTGYRLPATSRPRRSSCLPALLFIVVLLAISGGVIAFVAASTPFFFDNLFAGGFARLEQTYGSDATPSPDSIGAATNAVDVAVQGEGSESAGTIYVLTDKGRVVRFAAGGGSLGAWSIESKDIISASGIEVDGAGNVYIAEGSDLHKLSGDTGAEQRVITVSDIFGMSDVALAPDGSVLSFLGGSNDSIVRFDPTGMEVARYPQPFSELEPNTVTAPWLVRITTDSQGQIYLLNTSATGTPVFVFTSEGKPIKHFGVRGDGEGQFNSPAAIAVDSKGRIYVSVNNGVNVYDSTGKYVGIIRMPFFYRADGLAFDKKDRLYVVSRSEKKVYRFVLNEP